MALLGTKAVIYEDANTRALWASHGLDAWLLEPSKDHYCCNLYYVPEMKGYRISGSADLFPQHCIVPVFTPVMHVQELSTELQEILATMRCKKRTLLKTLAQHLDAYVSGTMPPQTEQRVEQKKGDGYNPTWPLPQNSNGVQCSRHNHGKQSHLHTDPPDKIVHSPVQDLSQHPGSAPQKSRERLSLSPYQPSCLPHLHP
jgi:hypothetical protein